MIPVLEERTWGSITQSRNVFLLSLSLKVLLTVSAFPANVLLCTKLHFSLYCFFLEIKDLSIIRNEWEEEKTNLKSSDTSSTFEDKCLIELSIYLFFLLDR